MDNKKRTFIQAQRDLLALQLEFSLAAGSNRVKEMEETYNKTISFPDGRERRINLNDLGNQDGNAALHHAALNGATNAVAWILDHGADIMVLNNQKSTPLHMAALGQKSTDSARLLLDRGAEIMLQNATGMTPLHIAAASDNTDIAALLLERGADIRAKNNNEDEPIHTAARNGKAKCLKLLFEKGSYDAPEHDQSRLKALELARMNNTKAAREYLEETEVRIAQDRKAIAERERQAQQKKHLDILDNLGGRRPGRDLGK